MSYEMQYQNIKIVAKIMLIEAGVLEDEYFETKVSDMAVHILDDLYYQNFTVREINNAITVLLLTAQLR